MIKYYQQNNQWDTDKQRDLIADMESLLIAFSDNNIPNENDYSVDDLNRYITSLVNGIADKPSGVIYSCWSVMPIETIADRDARVDFIFMPSHIVTATLSLFQRRFPDLAQTIEGFDQALRDAYRFSAITKFQGAGYDAITHQIRVLDILTLGNVPETINANPLSSVPLAVALYEAKLTLLEKISQGKTQVGFGRTDYTAEFRKMIEQLNAGVNKSLA